jgi:hypothetical protein
VREKKAEEEAAAAAAKKKAEKEALARRKSEETRNTEEAVLKQEADEEALTRKQEAVQHLAMHDKSGAAGGKGPQRAQLENIAGDKVVAGGEGIGASEAVALERLLRFLKAPHLAAVLQKRRQILTL